MMRKLLFTALLLSSAFGFGSSLQFDVGQQADEIVANYRKIIVLTSNQDSLDLAPTGMAATSVKQKLLELGQQ